MDEIKVYEQYFNKKANVICQVINSYKETGKTIALWGAGMRGQAFLNMFDSENTNIQYIYDLNQNKYGTYLQTGHEVVDYQKYKADVVMVANSAHELGVRQQLQEAGFDCKVINLDHIILGDLGEDIVHLVGLDWRPIRKCKVCALVIVYNPLEEVVDNIKSYAADVERVYVYDNSEAKNTRFVDEVCNIDNVEYISSASNNGLSIPINEIAHVAIEDEFDWLLTFDQDSKACDNMVNRMRAFANSSYCDESIAIIAPTIIESDKQFRNNEDSFTYFDKVMQSGIFNSLKAWDKVNGYDEQLFIEQVDYEYCARLIVNGYKVVRLNNAYLLHNQQDYNVKQYFVDGKHLFLNKYSPVRYYYRYRNSLYCYERYKQTNPIYALECRNVMNKIQKSIGLEDRPEIYEQAILQAKKDYANGVMGKFLGGL